MMEDICAICSVACRTVRLACVHEQGTLRFVLLLAAQANRFKNMTFGVLSTPAIAMTSSNLTYATAIAAARRSVAAGVASSILSFSSRT